MGKLNMRQIVPLISLVALLHQPVEAQRAHLNSSSIQTKQQEQRDVEFSRLYEDISLLEEILRKNPPKDAIGNKGYRRGVAENGAEYINEKFTPSNVEDVIEKTFYERTAKLVSRYGLEIPAESNIFTSGNSIIVSIPYMLTFGPFGSSTKNYLIIDEFSLILMSPSVGGGEVFNPYQRYVSLPTNTGFKIQSFPEVSKGIIPIFKNGDFPEIFERIKQYNEDIVSSVRWGYGDQHPRVGFPTSQLYNIAIMLAEAVDYTSDDVAVNFLSKHRYVANITSRTGGSRIIVSAATASPGPKESYINLGQMSLSIGNGDAKLWWSAETVISERFVLTGPRTYADLRIKFPISP